LLIPRDPTMQAEPRCRVRCWHQPWSRCCRPSAN